MSSETHTTLLDTPRSDYVDVFGRLLALEKEMRRCGPTRALLVAKANLELALGDPAKALKATQDALTFRDDAECRLLEATAWVHIARARAGGLTLVAGEHDELLGTPRQALLEARSALGKAARIDPDDPDVRAGRAWVQALMSMKDPARRQALAAMA